jgi:hypothetical protein
MEITEEKPLEYTISAGKATLLSFLLIVPITFVILGPFMIFWNFSVFDTGRQQLMNNFVLVLILGIILHEGLHGLGWAVYAKKGFRSIRFGINWKYLAPYCHCKEPLKVKHYSFGGALPLVVMGLIPSLVAIVIGNGFLICFGIFFTWAALGDIIMLFFMMRLTKDTIVADHPDKMGFYVIDNI